MLIRGDVNTIVSREVDIYQVLIRGDVNTIVSRQVEIKCR